MDLSTARLFPAASFQTNATRSKPIWAGEAVCCTESLLSHCPSSSLYLVSRGADAAHLMASESTQTKGSVPCALSLYPRPDLLLKTSGFYTACTVLPRSCSLRPSASHLVVGHVDAHGAALPLGGTRALGVAIGRVRATTTHGQEHAWVNTSTRCSVRPILQWTPLRTNEHFICRTNLIPYMSSSS